MFGQVVDQVFSKDTGDRLTPNASVLDTGANIKRVPLGSVLDFYRPKASNRLTFWCPLIFCTDFSSEPVLNPEHLVGDVLHTTDGGVSQYIGGAIFGVTIKHSEHVLGVKGNTAKVRHKAAAHRLRAMLDDWHLSDECKGDKIDSPSL